MNKFLTCFFVVLALTVNVSKSQEIEWINTSTNDNIVRSVEVLVEDINMNVYAATYGNGIYTSFVTGLSWYPSNDGIPDSSSIRSLVIKDETLVAGTSEGKIYKSIDNGSTWIETFQLAGSVNAIRFAPDGLLFAVTSEGKVYKSADQGSSWTEDTPAGSFIWDILILENKFMLLAVKDQGILKSTDMGQTWEISRTGLPAGNLEILNIGIDSSKTIFAGSKTDGLYKSDDNGQNWVSTSNNIGDNHISTQLHTSDAIFVGTTKGIFYSFDKGSNWMSINNQTLSQSTINSLLYASNDYILAGDNQGNIYRTKEKFVKNTSKIFVTISPNNKQIIDYGQEASFTVFAKDYKGIPIENALVHIVDNLQEKNLDINTDQEGKAVYTTKSAAGKPLGLYFVFFDISKEGFDVSGSINGQIELYHVDPFTGWNEVKNNLPDTNIVDIMEFEGFDGNLYAGLFGYGCYTSSDEGASWESRNAGLTAGSGVVKFLEAPFGVLFAATTSDGISKSTDGGMTWQSKISGTYTTAFDLIADGNGNLFATVFGGGVIKSENFGVDWQDFNTGLNLGFNSSAVFLEHIGNNIFVSSNRGDVYKSSSSEAGWTRVFDDTIPQQNFSNYLLNAGDQKLIYASRRNGIYLSDDLGENWENNNFGLQMIRINSLHFFNGVIYCSIQSTGLKVSPDFGTSWINFNKGLEKYGFYNLNSLEFTSSGWIYATAEISSKGGGLLRREQETIGVLDQIIENFKINVYPNPAKDFTDIKLTLPYSSDLNMEIYDISGEKIMSKDLGYYNAGENILQLNCIDLLNGSYYVQINMNDISISTKFIISR